MFASNWPGSAARRPSLGADLICLRQYDVGRSILLTQLAQAEKFEQQYAIAGHFDPFNAVAN